MKESGRRKEERLLKLNVGCGRDSWGDVRLEIDRDYWLHKRHSINFFADARFLPFRDKCFEELRIYHVLEHIQDWKQTLSECCRVSKILSIEVPMEPIILNVWMRGYLFGLGNFQIRF